MTKFKIGDLIERFEPSKGPLRPNITKGKVYKVTKPSTKTIVYVLDDAGEEEGYSPMYFKLAKTHIVKEIIKDL